MTVDVSEVSEKMRNIRSERYAMQSVAKKALGKERVSKCLRQALNGHNVQVWKHSHTQKAFYNGLLVCGSVWNCPVCASKISEKRRLELKQAFDAWRIDSNCIPFVIGENAEIAFLTLTFSHSKFDSLKEILDKFTAASRKFKSGRDYQNIKNALVIVGTIKALEITYSDRNGFHPHSHEIIFYKNSHDLDKIRKMFWILWQRALSKVGLKATEDYGLTLQSGQSANDYLSKFGKGNWTLEHEMTKAHIKQGKNEQSLTPFDFLKFHLVTGDEKYISLFKEYAQVFKGKRQLVWSRGLKKLFQIDEKTDEELAKEKTEEADLLGLLSIDDWKLILKHNYRAKLLDNIEKFGYFTGLEITFSYLLKINGDAVDDITIKKNSRY